MKLSDQLTAVFTALADPTRRAILQRLTTGDANVAELAAPFAMSQPAISKHLRVLEGAGLISRNRVATARFSHLQAEPLKEASEYMEKYRHFWISSFDRLDAALATYQSEKSAEKSENGTEKNIDTTESVTTEPDSTEETNDE